MQQNQFVKILILFIFFIILSGNLNAVSTDGKPTTQSDVDTTPIEGQSDHISYFLLEISKPLSFDVSVDFTTRDDTAIAGQDYIATSDTATIKAGETYTSIGVEIIGDTITENNESFLLALSNPKGASFPPGVTEISSTKTIIDDDNGLFDVVSDDNWSTTAVRKVLHIFAYGGHATDEQVEIWASMPPSQAINEMLIFAPSNLKLSPNNLSSKDIIGTNTDGTLRSLSSFWASNKTDNILENQFKQKYLIDNYWYHECFQDLSNQPYFSSNFTNTWIHSVLAKGGNPFMHKIGFWETNYHMVSNNAVGEVRFWNQMNHYDNIISALMQNKPYEEVIGIGALDASIGLQYGHINNYWLNGFGGNDGNIIENGIFGGNEDFAREFHQIFFGVLGEQEHDYHENITIKNTAKALTDIRFELEDISAQCDFDDVRGFPDNRPEFGTSYHHSDSLEMYHQQIAGNDAKEKIMALAKVTIEQPESLNNLPVLVISSLADDNLSEAKKETIQQAWAKMKSKDLLIFLRSYAISPLFHSSKRIKYLTSFDRNLITANRLDIDNSELHRMTNVEEGWYWSLPESLNWGAFQKEKVEPFKPIHDVFGHQTGIEAINSPSIFLSVYNRSAEPWNFNFTVIREQDNWQNIIWSKDMSKVIPKDSQGKYTVKHIAEVLWDRLVADGLKNLDTLERAHLYALLSDYGSDLGLRFKELGLISDENHIFSKQELDNNAQFVSQINQLSTNEVAIDSSDDETRTQANERINLALAFISATPYMFIQEGK